MAAPTSGNAVSQIGTLVVTTAGVVRARTSQVGALVINTTTATRARVSQVGLLVISPSPKIPASIPPGAQVLSWWKLDEAGLGQPAQDAGPANVPGYDNNSTTHAATTVAPLNFGNTYARNFPAGNVGLFADAGAAHNLLDNFTVSAWVKPGSFSAAMAIMSRLTIANGTGWNLIVNSGGTAGVVNFHAMNGAGVHSYAGVGGAPLSLNTWSHVVAVMRAGVRYVYVNGVVRGSSDSSTMAPTPSSAKTYIGEWASDLTSPWFGDLDDVRYYNIALSDAQIQFLADGFDLAGADLVGYWKLDEVGTAQIAYDSSLLVANAPDQAGSSFDTTTPAPIAAPTAFNNPHSRSFPGPPLSWLNAGIQAVHGFTQNFTVACWYRSPTSGLASVPLVTHQNASPTTKGWGLMVAPTVGGPGRTLPAGTYVAVLQACTAVGPTLIYADVALQLGVWTHIAGVFYASTGQLFVNGVKQSAVLTTMPAASTDLPTYLGRDYSQTGGATQIIGDLDEVRIYKVALTDEQISNLAAGSEPFATTVTKTHSTDSSVLAQPVTVTKTHITDSQIVATIVATATFVQRDNWRNGAWIGAYGSQGYEVIYSDEVNLKPPWVTYAYFYTSGSVDSWGRPGIYTDPRFFQCAGTPAQTSAGVLYAAGVGEKVVITYLFDVDHTHAVSIAAINVDTPPRRFHINVYDNDTNALLDGPRDVGDFYTTDVYMTWNVSGHVRFECVVDNNLAGIGALFLDLPRSVYGVSHSTDCYTYVPVVVPASLVGWWKLDETGTGQTAIDSSATGANATDVLGNTTDSTPAPVTFTNPRGRNFPGTSGSYLNAGVQSAHNLTQNFTISLWLRPTTPLAGQTQPLLVRTALLVNSGWSLTWDQTLIQFTHYSPTTGGSTVYVSYALPVGVWTHLVAIAYATNAKVFVSGRKQAATGNRLGAANASLSTQIGQDASDYPNNWYKGDLDDIRLYNIALTDDQIQSLAGGNEPFQVTPTIRTHTTGSLTAPEGPALITITVTHSTDTLLPATAVKTHSTDANVVIPATATFVQRDNWRNGTWIDAYGSQGYWVVNATTPDMVLPPGVSFSQVGGSIGSFGDPGIYMDLRYLQVPGDPTHRSGGLIYTASSMSMSFTFLLGDSQTHALSFTCFNTNNSDRRLQISVYDNDTNTLLDGPRNSDDYYTTDVYLTWNVSGHVRFEITDISWTQLYAVIAAFFIDPPRSVHGVSHSTSSNLVGNLIGYWKLDETGTGQVAVDSSPLGANATDVLGTSIPSTPAPVQFTNPHGRNTENDATYTNENYLNAGVQPAHSLTQNFTVSGWVRHRMDDNHFATILSHNDYPHTGGWSLLISNGFRGNFYAVTPSGMFPVYDYYGDPIPPEVWVHLAGVAYDSTRALFVNGRKVTVGSYFVMPAPSPSLSTYIGKWFNGSYYGNSSLADFDDIRLYNVPLTDDQIQTLAYGTFDPFVVTAIFQTHSTAALLFAEVIQTHDVDSLLSTSVIQTHKTDTLLPATVVKTHGTNASVASASPAATAVFVQRDNWRNGNWIGHYGTQGYDVFNSGVPELMPPGVSYTRTGFNFYSYGAPDTDLRLPQVPGDPTRRASLTWFTGTTGSYTFLLDDGHTHSVSIFFLDYEAAARRFYINVYDADTNALIAGRQDSGDYGTTSVYMTWNVQGHVRFDITVDTHFGTPLDSATTFALFIDPPMSVNGVSHSTSTSLRVASNLIAWWKLDETGTGTTAVDSSLLGANATDTLGTTIPSTPAPLNFINPSGRHFLNDAGYLDAGVQAAHGLSQNFTVSCWVRVAVRQDMAFVTHADEWQENGWGLLISSFGTPIFEVYYGGSSSSVWANDVIPLGVWVHVLGIVYTNSIQLYVNGSPQEFGNSGRPDPSPGLATHIGHDPVYGYQLTGDLDDIRIYSVALTDEQISILAAGNEPFPTVEIRIHSTASYLSPAPVTPAATAVFVQRDNWLNGTWIGTYGTKGYAVFGSGVPDLMPPASSYHITALEGPNYVVYSPPGTYNFPQILQVPDQPDVRVHAIYYTAGDIPVSFEFYFDDGQAHAVSLHAFIWAGDTSFRFHVNVVDLVTNVVLDGPRDSGDYRTTSVYLTWNVRGHVRFDVFRTPPTYANLGVDALFVAPPTTVGEVSHSTDAYLALAPPPATASFVQRDNWRNGAWIGHYGTQGYSLFLSGYPAAVPPDYLIPDVIPTGISYILTGPYGTGPIPAVYTDPRYLQDPTRPGYSTVAWLYNAGPTDFMVVLFDDDLVHAVTLFNLDYIHVTGRFTITVYDNDTGALLDGPREVGDFSTTGIYMTWNVRGHIRFHAITLSDYSVTNALFIDPPMSVGGATHNTDILVSIPPPPVTTVTVTHGTNSSLATVPAVPATAVFVQRDNWRGGAWINQYGTQGHAVFLSGTPTVLPPGVSYKAAGGKYDCWLPPGTYTDQRLPQVPGQPDKTAAAVYHTEETECFFFNFDDGLEHAVSIFSLDYDQGDLRHQISVYNDSSDTLLDGPREVDDQYTNSVYMTWNVTGHVRFELVTEAENAVATGWFIDPPISVRTVSHGTNTSLDRIHATASFLQRDNWRNGFWINAYGSQGYSVFGAEQPDVIPPGLTYTRAGGTQGWWQSVGIWTDPRYQQVPNYPEKTVGGVYWANNTTESFTFLFDDSLVHAVSIYTWSNDTSTQRQEFLVYDADTNELIDGPQASGETNSHGVYMTWNVRGHVRFDAVQVAEAVLTSAIFVDPMMSVGMVSHDTSSFTSVLAVATITVTHKTDSFLRQAIVGSRSRSQRVGTRTLAFGDSP